MRFLPVLISSLALARRSLCKPNIVFIFTDDQDLHHSSVDTMQSVQELATKGTSFSNHFATIAVCCPSRVSLMRGQAAHNTNNTAISSPGGGYPKFVASGEDDDYLPHWLVKAGYSANYIGKLYNGNAITNYSPAPKGWSHIDVLLEPYINFHDTVVMSENGKRPVWYGGWQQTDVVRIKALSRLETLLGEDDPFFLMIAPTAPHVHNLTDPPIPPARYLEKFSNMTVPRVPNFNPPDEEQKGKPSWLKTLPALNQTQINDIDHLYRRRLQALQGVDDIVKDVVTMLEGKNALDDTYVIFSTDQGYHLGTHRHSGKCLPYLEDTNIPLVVRGPGVPASVTSRTPSTVTDFAPTFLEIAGLAAEDYPPFLDGASLLEAWENPNSSALAKKKEAINVEYWGSSYTEIPTWAEGSYGIYFPGLYLNNTYKTMRVVGEHSSWLYSRWCTNDTELYNTKDDPYELTNLADSSDPEIVRVKSRLNALLMVTKSCAEDTCRDPWSVLQPPNDTNKISTLDDALDPRYDGFFAAFPQVSIDECLNVQLSSNEGPFYPVGAENGLGLAYRKNTDFFSEPDYTPVKRVPANAVPAGGWDQRYATVEDLLLSARELTDEELSVTEG
ncbi:Arylsulfatase [Lasiodiplodia theobromae]|uniref:Arylsulfatase n=1 Tax=Lasiodiplodia theobromae TaxID=45133 RepID=UPI0015C3D670|nr:Arylsulfatase [Lasiodiplodia theobromae]KAF4534980.1 Arylsulfatase [Lasiodiplodia theobromae]